jgi:hypothetical protein
MLTSRWYPTCLFHSLRRHLPPVHRSPRGRRRRPLYPDPELLPHQGKDLRSPDHLPGHTRGRHVPYNGPQTWYRLGTLPTGKYTSDALGLCRPCGLCGYTFTGDLISPPRAACQQVIECTKVAGIYLERPHTRDHTLPSITQAGAYTSPEIGAGKNTYSIAIRNPERIEYRCALQA